MTAPQNLPGGRPSRAVAPGWHPDPAGRHEVRYWDGHRWTEHVGDAGRSAVDPLPVLGLGATRARGTSQQESARRPGCLTVLLAALAGLATAAVILIGAYLVLRGLGRGGDPPRWIGVVATAAAAAVIYAVAYRRRTPPSDRS